MPSIKVDSLCKSFGAFAAVSDVSFSIPEGGFCTLLGPSGCGKSTTLRLIAGLERPDSGTISIGSEVVSGRNVFMPPEQRRLGYVFQSYALWPHMKAVDQVAYPLRTQGVDRRQIAEMVAETLDVVGLSAETYRYPSELSGGQQQRVALARALVFRPSILLLDEPLSNLDAELRVQLRTEIHELRKRINVTTIHVTHDQQEALSLSDLVVVMERGRVVEMGTPEDIYARPKELHTAMFVGSGNTLDGRVLSVGQDGAVEVELANGERLTGARHAALSVGDRVVVLFRPEDVAVCRTSGRVGESLTGEVTGRMYYGGYSMLTVRAAGVELRVQTGKGETVKPGDQVSLEFAPGGVMVFPFAAGHESRKAAPAAARQGSGAEHSSDQLAASSGAAQRPA